MITFKTTTDIEADAAAVWSTLTAGEHYPNWDSGVVSVEGPIALGGKIKITSEVNPGRTLPDLQPSFDQFANGLKAEVERSQKEIEQ